MRPAAATDHLRVRSGRPPREREEKIIACLQPPPARTTHSTITLLAVAAFFSGAAIRLCDGLIPRLANDFAITPGRAGAVVIWFAVAYGLMQLVFGPLADRYGKARVMGVAVNACALMAGACALASSFEALVWLRMAWGVAAAGVIPLAMAWIGDVVPFEERQPVLARLLLGTLSGMMAGQLAGGLFADTAAGWRGAFLANGLGYLVVGTLMVRRLQPGKPAAPGAASNGLVGQFANVLREPWSRWVMMAAVAEGVFLLGPLAYLPTYLHQRFGVALSGATALVALFAVGGLLYALLARQLVRSLGQRRMVQIGGLLMGAGFLAWWLSPVAWSAAPVALIAGFGTYLYHNTLQTHATQMAPAARGSSMALFACSLFMGQALGTALAGWAHDHLGAAPAMIASAVVLPAAGLVFAWRLRRREQAGY